MWWWWVGAAECRLHCRQYPCTTLAARSGNDAYYRACRSGEIHQKAVPTILYITTHNLSPALGPCMLHGCIAPTGWLSCLWPLGCPPLSAPPGPGPSYPRTCTPFISPRQESCQGTAMITCLVRRIGEPNQHKAMPTTFYRITAEPPWSLHLHAPAAPPHHGLLCITLSTQARPSCCAPMTDPSLCPTHVVLLCRVVARRLLARQHPRQRSKCRSRPTRSRSARRLWLRLRRSRPLPRRRAALQPNLCRQPRGRQRRRRQRRSQRARRRKAARSRAARK